MEKPGSKEEECDGNVPRLAGNYQIESKLSLSFMKCGCAYTGKIYFCRLDHAPYQTQDLI